MKATNLFNKLTKIVGFSKVNKIETEYKSYSTAELADYLNNDAKLIKQENEPIIPINAAEPENRYTKQGGWYVKNAQNTTNTATIKITGTLNAEPQLQNAVRYGDNFNFRPSFSYVKPIFAETDLVIANLNSAVCPSQPYSCEQTEDDYRPNSPLDYLNALKYANIDFLTLSNANNADFGANGIKETLFNVDKCNFGNTGLFLPEEKQKFLLIDVNGIKIAVLSYTENFSDSIENLTQKGVDILLNKFSVEKLKQDISSAKNAGAEFILVSINFEKLPEIQENLANLENDETEKLDELEEKSENVEKSTEDISQQTAENKEIFEVDETNESEEDNEFEEKSEFEEEIIEDITKYIQLSQQIADNGANYIIFNTPNTIREYDIIKSANGQNVPVCYSLGSIFSGENRRTKRHNIILSFTLLKENGKVKIADETYIPCCVYGYSMRGKFTIIPAIEQLNGGLKSQILTESHEQIGQIVKHKIAPQLDTSITSKFVYEGLGLEIPEKLEVFSRITFASTVAKNDLVFMLFENETPIESPVPFMLAELNYIIPEEEVDEIADKAIEQGAKMLVHTSQIKDYPCLIVPNVLESFVILVEKYRRQFSPYTIAITGSVGKTTTTYMIERALAKHENTLRSHLARSNSLKIIPHVIQRLKPTHDYYVQEMAESSYQLQKAKIVKPNMLVVTLIGTAHSFKFASKADVLTACLEFQKGMPDDGLLIMNADDELQAAAETRLQKVLYALDNPQADYRAVNITTNDFGTEFDILHKNAKITHLQINFYGKHNVYNALAAFVALKLAGQTDEKIQSGLLEYSPEGIRQNFIKIGNYSLFLDCFNASLESIKSLFGSLPYLPPKNKNGKYIAVLGDLSDLGWFTEAAHESVGKIVANSEINILICYGENSQIVAKSAMESKGNNLEVYHTENFEELTQLMLTKITPLDFVLIKGSRDIFLEFAVDMVFGTWLSALLSKDYGGEIVSKRKYNCIVAPNYVKINKYKGKTENIAIIPEKVDEQPVYSIGEKTFIRSAIFGVNFPNSIRNIRYAAFFQCNNLTRIVLPKKLRILAESAFSRCENLCEVVMGDEVLEIRHRAFGNCKNLRQINIPPSCTVIDEEAFLNCENLTIYGKIGSFAEEYAMQNNISFAEDNFPFVHAHCICIMDSKNGAILYEKNANIESPLFSTAKIITAIIALEQANLDDIFTVPEITSKGLCLGFAAGEKISLKDLLYALLLPSACNAAETIAVNLAGSEEEFAKKMNVFAKNIGMVSCNFNSPSGLPIQGMLCTASAKDMAILTQYAMKNPVFRQIVNTKTYACETDTNKYFFEQTNALLHTKQDAADYKYSAAFGVKTGSLNCKYNLISAAEKGENQHICVQLDISDDYKSKQAYYYRFEDAKILHEWAFENIENSKGV
ncbi:MAG: Mur ligase family protein [Firmicutes bacterium]|nr:Mur ligase family protein [Bacillota bacterium]